MGCGKGKSDRPSKLSLKSTTPFVVFWSLFGTLLIGCGEGTCFSKPIYLHVWGEKPCAWSHFSLLSSSPAFPPAYANSPPACFPCDRRLPDGRAEEKKNMQSHKGQWLDGRVKAVKMSRLWVAFLPHATSHAHGPGWPSRFCQAHSPSQPYSVWVDEDDAPPDPCSRSIEPQCWDDLSDPQDQKWHGRRLALKAAGVQNDRFAKEATNQEHGSQAQVCEPPWMKRQKP